MGFIIKSTSLATFSFIKNVTESLDDRKHDSVVFFDMSNAFGFVDHSILLRKGDLYGIRGNALNWLESYLSNSKQCVEIIQINTKQTIVSQSSSYQINRVGVPEGMYCALGPLLFLSYIVPKVTD